MALQSTLESRDTDACEVESDVTIETLSENVTNLNESNSFTKSHDSTIELTQLSIENLNTSPKSLPLANKTSESTSSRSSSMSIPRSKSPDMSKLSRSFNSNITPDILISSSAAQPVSSTTDTFQETKPSPKGKAESLQGEGEPPSSTQPHSSINITSSLPIADSLEETKFVKYYF